jgi:hypothetical protein
MWLIKEDYISINSGNFDGLNGGRGGSLKLNISTTITRQNL